VSGMSRITMGELLDDLLTDYRVNDKATLQKQEGVRKTHLTPYFGHRRACQITTADVRKYVDGRQQLGASNATINRELAAIKRAFSLAVQCTPPRLMVRPYIPMLEENNLRTGFFERDQFESVRSHLPEELRVVVTFAYITGWRINSEILTLQWNQVDLKAGMVRLNPGATKNKEGRLFPFKIDAELTAVLEAQKANTAVLQKDGIICPWCFIVVAGQSKTAGRRGRTLAGERVFLAASPTTSGERQRETSSAPTCLGLPR
jgi:integrase